MKMWVWTLLYFAPCCMVENQQNLGTVLNFLKQQLCNFETVDQNKHGITPGLKALKRVHQGQGFKLRCPQIPKLYMLAWLTSRPSLQVGRNSPTVENSCHRKMCWYSRSFSSPTELYRRKGWCGFGRSKEVPFSHATWTQDLFELPGDESFPGRWENPLYGSNKW